MSEPKDPKSIVDEVVRFLTGLPGIVAAQEVPGTVMDRVVELENRYEVSALAPTRCIGVRIAAARETVIGIIKDRDFRKAPRPTVYMVEENVRVNGPPDNYLSIEGENYLIVGEELFPSRMPYAEKTVLMGDSFVIFPNRVSGSAVPSFFMIPPLEFPELEENAGSLDIRGVLSVSPSPPADRYLREYCGFSDDVSMATLLVAFNCPQRS